MVNKLIAIICLVSLPVFGEELPSDAPVAAKIKGGLATIEIDGVDVEYKLPEGLFLNALAVQNVEEFVKNGQKENAALLAENGALKKDLDRLVADPPLNLKTVAIIAAGALLVGAGLGAGAILLIK